MAASAPSSSSALLEHYLPTNPAPFAIAIALLGVVMLAYPRAAVALGAVIVLGALVADQRAVAAVHAGQIIGTAAPPAASVPATEQLLLAQKGMK